MSRYILTLMTPQEVTEQAISALAKNTVEQAAGSLGGCYPLNEQASACDFSIVLPGPDAENALLMLLESMAGSQGFDYGLHKPEWGSRKKKLLLADMDSTLVEGECIDELAAFMDIKAAIEAITAKAMRGELLFEDALRQRVAMLKGLQRKQLESLLAELPYTAGARELVTTMVTHGAYTAVISGGFTPFTERVKADLGMQHQQANTLLWDEANGTLSGEVTEPILGKEAKLNALKQLCQQHGLCLNQAITIGDGANDLAMIQAAGMGVAYRAKPIVAEQARFKLRHMDLTGALYLQGYHQKDWVL